MPVGATGVPYSERQYMATLLWPPDASGIGVYTYKVRLAVAPWVWEQPCVWDLRRNMVLAGHVTFKKKKKSLLQLSFVYIITVIENRVGEGAACKTLTKERDKVYLRSLR